MSQCTKKAGCAHLIVVDKGDNMDFVQDIIERKREKKKNKFDEWERKCESIRKEARERDYTMLPDGSLLIP